jgi:thiol-disulfide isomerase/thioredoxin
MESSPLKLLLNRPFLAALAASFLLASLASALWTSAHQRTQQHQTQLVKKERARLGYRRPSYRSFPSLEAAIRAAKSEKKPLFLDLFAIWCTPCKRLEEQTFSHPVIAPLLDRFLVVKFDIDRPEGKRIVARYKIQNFPTTLALDSEGHERERIVGFYEARFFRPPLEAVLAGRERIDDLAREVLQRPDAHKLRLRYADRLLLRREVEKARVHYQRLQQADTQDKMGVGAAALFGEARSYSRVNDYAKAITRLEHFHRLYPTHPLRIDAYRLHIQSLQKRNQHTLAKEMLATFQKRYPHATLSFD